MEGAAHDQHRRACDRGVPPAGQDAGGAALGGQRAALAVRSGGVGTAAVPQARRLPGTRSGRPSGRVTMTPVSSDLEIVAVRAAMEADSWGDYVGRGATLLFNRLRGRARPHISHDNRRMGACGVDASQIPILRRLSRVIRLSFL